MIEGEESQLALQAEVYKRRSGMVVSIDHRDLPAAWRDLARFETFVAESYRQQPVQVQDRLQDIANEITQNPDQRLSEEQRPFSRAMISCLALRRLISPVIFQVVLDNIPPDKRITKESAGSFAGWVDYYQGFSSCASSIPLALWALAGSEKGPFSRQIDDYSGTASQLLGVQRTGSERVEQMVQIRGSLERQVALLKKDPSGMKLINGLGREIDLIQGDRSVVVMKEFFRKGISFGQRLYPFFYRLSASTKFS